jgi:hypothetical protein
MVRSSNFFFKTNKCLGFTFCSTKALRTTIYAANKGATVAFPQDKVSIAVSKPIRQLRFTATEEQIIVAVEGGEVFIYNVNDLESQVCY